MAETDGLQRTQEDIFLSDLQNEDDGGKRKKKAKAPTIGITELFRFADSIDVALMVLGTVMAMVHGAVLPLMCGLFGKTVDQFVVYSRIFKSNSSAPITNDTFEQDITVLCIYFAITAATVLLAAYVQVAFWTLAAGRQVRRIRELFFHNVIRQDISWFDTNKTGHLITHLTDNIDKIQEGIGDKLGMLIKTIFTFILCLLLGLSRGWKLTLVMLAISPLLGISAAFFIKLLTSFTAKEQAAYAKAGIVAEEVLSSIRTVFAFSGQQKEIERYHKDLEEAKEMGVKKAISSNMAMGFTFMVIHLTYALAFWYGSTLVMSGEYTVGNIFTVLFAIFLGVFALGQISPQIEALANARGAAYTVYRIIDNKPSIDSYSESGFKPDFISGNIEFKNIHFNYPSRPDVKVLNNMSLSVKSGQTMALVGSSGCGKSTTIQLLQRFYDPQEGSISIDDHDIRSLNIRYLREMIGVVSQEPILFATTIAENIRYGRLDVTQQEIEQAAKEANAYDFIINLPDKFETLVGDRGTQMSGGQKQRIAIARVLVCNPKILLLDEATSALDAESETLVQAALNKVRLGRTTIVVAHRLSTIRNADVIAGVQNGEVVELGTHSQLMEKQGLYYNLVNMQTFEKEEEQYEEQDDKNPQSKHFSECIPYRRKSTRGSSFVGSAVKKEEKEMLVDPKDKTERNDLDLASFFLQCENVAHVSVLKVMRYNIHEWPYLLLGLISASINGIVHPVHSLIMAKFVAVFVETDQEVMRKQTNFLSIMFTVIGVVSFLSFFLKGFCFGKSGEILTMKLRLASFKALMRQDIGWFDHPENNVGVLTTRLASDTSKVQAVTGQCLAAVIQSIANIGTGMILSFVKSWELTLFLLVIVPIMIVGGFFRMRAMTGQVVEDKVELEKAGKIFTEAIENIRTVASLTREPEFESLYSRTLQMPYKTFHKQAHVQGFLFSFTMAFVYFTYAGYFRFGAWVLKNRQASLEGIFFIFSAMVYGSIAIGEATSFAPNYASAKLSAAHITALLNRKPPIDNLSQEGQSLDQFDGNVEFEGVKFSYPSRPNIPVLRGLNLKLSKGKTLALVGSSGCGKSTTIQLLERFYDTAHGTVTFDSKNVKELNIHSMRSHIGIVSQEPVLFDCSLAENIAYGDNSRTVTMEEIKAAAEAANIHSFIESLPKKYDTQAGDKGTQLSGGQKQRIAIARAILRNPKLLLLDEATSALDAESEKVVQEALDKARQGRTCIVIAHRLSTIQNADSIAVIQGGVVVEQGTHQQLLAKKGIYHMLVTTQMGHGRERGDPKEIH
uniref:ATP-dependent translocase ABCB1-like isoform X3 n=1 Tax=Doryrhamphus excisus TaxID=161450 RepID=UPI0025AD9F43|nr:ATP-dependent translocase ABCB1-like isoform X3 [Doryrhamphus excisus]